jgi:hypothetical protein
VNLFDIELVPAACSLAAHHAAEVFGEEQRCGDGEFGEWPAEDAAPVR